MSESLPTSELRWHPLLRQWVAVSTNRQGRPQMPKDWCPFCPGSGRVPETYDVLLFPNDFPAFSETNPPFAPVDGLFTSTGARGVCDVVLYSPEHTLLPSELSTAQWQKVVELWSRRTAELVAIADVQYVAVFENTGEAIGVTMPHPHGQIYAFPFVPPLPTVELASAAAHHTSTGHCLYCELLEGELRDGRRIVAENDHFIAFLPYFGRFPTELSIYSRRHFGSLLAFSKPETESFAEMLSLVRRKYDALFSAPMPLMMLVRQAPAKGDHPYFHFHVDFLPIQRAKNKLKYLASVESGTGSFLNDTLPEEQAAILREIKLPDSN